MALWVSVSLTGKIFCRCISGYTKNQIKNKKIYQWLWHSNNTKNAIYLNFFYNFILNNNRNTTFFLQSFYTFLISYDWYQHRSINTFKFVRKCALFVFLIRVKFAVEFLRLHLKI